MKKGKIIVLEGATDGMGKSTQLQELKNHFKEDSVSIYTHHFPSYDSVQGNLVTEYLKGNLGKLEELNPYLINTFYAVDRAVTWNKELKSEFNKGKVLLLDRYTTSSLIYQSAFITNLEEKKKFLDYVATYEYEKLGIPKPDKVIFLYGDFDVINELRMSRVDNEGVKNDIHESNLEFLKKVYDSALFVADYFKWDKINCTSNGKMRTIKEISEEIYEIAKK